MTRSWTCLRCGTVIAEWFSSVCWCSDECMVGDDVSRDVQQRETTPVVPETS